MTFDEIKLQRLRGQHLLQKADTQTVAKDLCGVQSQYLSHAEELYLEGVLGFTGSLIIESDVARSSSMISAPASES